MYWNACSQDGRRLGESARWKIIVEDNHVTLLIYEVKPEDGGRYDCVLINKLGQVASTATLAVLGNQCRTQLNLLILER
jgi:hypothetical protein